MNMLNLLSPRAVEATTRYFERMRKAREIDPEAFEATMIPHFSSEQIARQRRAIAQAEL